MSYILEALRKSEESRGYRYGHDLSISDLARSRTSRPMKKIMPLLSLALLVNAAVLGAWLLWPDRGPAQVAGVTPAMTETSAVRTPAQLPETTGSAVADVPAVTREVDPGWRQRAPQSIGALPMQVRTRLPALSISTHIYASEPRDREVSINGRTYREGDSVEGLEVLRITESGVRLGFEQRVIELDIRDDWN